MSRSKSKSVKAPPRPKSKAAIGRTPAEPKFDLSKIRHDLRTPINHILGYCEMLQEDEQIPDQFLPDLGKIHAGGKQLLALIAEYFDEETYKTKRGDVQRLCHDLRTPVNQIIGYSEMLQDEAEEMGRKKYLPDLRKIRDAAASWLALMEEHLLPGNGPHEFLASTPDGLTGTRILPPGVTFQAPAAAILGPPRRVEGRLLVVDDDESNRDMLSRRLQRDGYAVQVAANGVDAIRLLRSTPFDLLLLDLIMPGLDGYQVLLKMKIDPALKEIPVIMLSALDQEAGIARCIEMGAEDCIAKPFSPVFLRARIEASLEKKRLRDKERHTYEALVVSEKRLAAELAEAAVYVRSLLPARLEGELQVRWHFQPSAELGGDIFGYHWLDADRFVIYLLDVSGHGVGAALLSVSIYNVLRAQSLPGTDFADPSAVLNQLNRVFQMERQNNLLFTIWYGVFDRPSRRLTYASGGHPPAVLVENTVGQPSQVKELSSRGPILGCNPSAEYRAESCAVPSGSQLYVFSDGVFEITGADGRTKQFTDLLQQIAAPREPRGPGLGHLISWTHSVRGEKAFEDDLSLMELEF